ncbi:hypothetical protein AHiyo1_24560 [Arthrobacter sp. Hiyo1]|nr:hypothetical protein AHiyo1_24560 [Arthrobacter sp. Hiyo1]
MTTRKAAAISGEPKRFRIGFSRTKPMIPAGTVPTTRSQPSFAYVSDGAIFLSRIERPRPLAISIQSRRKKKNSTIAVARWVAMRKFRNSGAFWSRPQPKSLGRMTLWPRLEIGKSSVIPCSRPMTMAWIILIMGSILASTGYCEMNVCWEAAGCQQVNAVNRVGG